MAKISVRNKKAFKRTDKAEKSASYRQNKAFKGTKPNAAPKKYSSANKALKSGAFIKPPKLELERKPNRASQGEAEGGLIIKGRHEVTQALSSKQSINTVYMSSAVKGSICAEIRELSRLKNVPLKIISSEIFNKKFGFKSQGIAAECGVFEYTELEALIKKLENEKPVQERIIVALNRVEDPRNLGAVVRTAEAAGAGGVIIPKHRAAQMTEWAISTAQGAASILPVVRVNNLSEALIRLKNSGYWVVGLDGAAQKHYNEVEYSSSTVIVLGGEDAGLGERVMSLCDDVVAIPLKGKTPSLNVSVSAAIALYEVLRQKNFFN